MSWFRRQVPLAVGQRWAFISQENPWATRVLTVEITDLAEGWVRYAFVGGDTLLSERNAKTLKEFRRLYNVLKEPIS